MDGHGVGGRRESVSQQQNYRDEQSMQTTTEQQPSSTEAKAPSRISQPKVIPAVSGTSTPVEIGSPSPATTLSSRPGPSSQKSDYFSSRRKLEPPVTRATLSELDVHKIVHNPKLHHDINFDPELHFRPNLDGEKGQKKQARAQQFWQSLASQLRMFMTDRDSFMSLYGQGQEWCLPMLLSSVKDIINTLVPHKDREQLAEGLNVPHIMQQFAHGMADLEKLASWLSGVLKSHCAPMRDEWVDEMYTQLTNGNRNNDIDELVKGMRSLLSVLEAMKLDVANHQIRCLRPVLIEETVAFEDRFFRKKLREGKFDATAAKDWYTRMSERTDQHHQGSAQAFGDMAIFFESIVELIMPSRSEAFPNTFLFDEERMSKLRSDMLDAINLELCMRLYDKLDRASPTFEPTATTGAALPLDLVMDDDSDCQSTSSARSSMVFSSAGSPHASPRSSLVCPTRPASTRPQDRKVKSQELYASLVSLLQSCPATSQPAQRWQAMKDSLALQIFRFSDAPTSDLMMFEDMLDLHLSETASELFQEVEKDFRRRLVVELQQRVKTFKNLGAVSLFSVATGGRLPSSGRASTGPSDASIRGRARNPSDDGSVADMATRLAHLGLLHWRVWGPLVYCDEDTDVEMS
ncbi:putative camp-mediated signaling protein SOK1 [Microdochium trichocladiopsis]|uniref:Camp-mediated signaling protein SOK1 n=1 Tax=Microdochium trichocladiopsis TaxID=1682393 RepID=A0A9P8XZ46_9PEZI|nr:putative camp-mediated signaling protein SOK1 [Microdochium trichocladiopsis]KAH7021189.1 putative camp-mediated signaling protein SOK1 [Microdochium trichocladiopsis]